MTQSPILKVLFTFRKFGVRNLLIGGQACIIYGAAEFSRDSDFVVLCETDNLIRLKKALRALRARNIYVPALEKKFLDKGHACHFRCSARQVKNLRIDILSKLRGCGDFAALWQKRTTVKFPGKKENKIEVIGLSDLVQSKKTQRDKDWLMLNRLIENDIHLTARRSPEKIKWWLNECRNPNTLIILARRYRSLTNQIMKTRLSLKAALSHEPIKLQKLLAREEMIEREKDKEYWAPLRAELERLRHVKISKQARTKD